MRKLLYTMTMILGIVGVVAWDEYGIEAHYLGVGLIVFVVALISEGCLGATAGKLNNKEKLK